MYDMLCIRENIWHILRARDGASYLGRQSIGTLASEAPCEARMMLDVGNEKASSFHSTCEM